MTLLGANGFLINRLASPAEARLLRWPVEGSWQDAMMRRFR